MAARKNEKPEYVEEFDEMTEEDRAALEEEKRLAKTKVTITLFKDGGKYKDDITVGHNGRIYKIQRGVPVEIPYPVWKIIQDSQKQDMETANMITQKEDEYRAESARLGL